MGSQKSTPLSNAESASFCAQMALILKSGISSIEGITIMLEDTKELNEKKLLSQIYETLLQTGSLYQALTVTEAFPDYLLHMVQIGEQTGKLDEVMDSLSNYYEKEANLAQTIKQAIAYPLIMVVMMILVILILITKVMPIFNQVLEQLGGGMTGFSLAILRAGEFLGSHSIVFLCVLTGTALFFLLFFKFFAGKNLFQSLVYRFASTKELSEQIAAYRFSSGMALTLSSGLAPEECLRQALKLTQAGPFRRKLDNCHKAVSKGEDLCNALLKADVFNGIYARMAVIGSHTGVLDEVMHTIARQYEEEIDARFSDIIAKVEPTLVIILSVIVGAILLSVMLPLMGILTTL